MGISKGMKRISDANVVLAIGILIVVLFSGSAVFTLKMATTSLGIIAENFITMSSWMDPFGVSGGFPEWWTVFYWAWSAMYAPFYGLFFAKISKGRTMAQMIAGTVGFGSLGCFSVFEILGGYGMFMNSSGAIDMVANQATLGDAGAIVALFQTLPMEKLMLILIMIVIILFSATTYDATSGILADVSMHALDENGQSKPWLRLLWAGLLVCLPAGFIISGSQLGPLQTITIIFALPVTIICIMTVISFFRMVKEDVAAGKFEFPEKR
jgi:BCCT family betaine/carnitine transporter